MKKGAFQFPHFLRLIHARLFFGLEMGILWLALATIIAVNIWSLQKAPPAHWNKLMMLFQPPFSAPAAVDLASFLWKAGKREEARNLVASVGSGQVLGAWEQEDRRVVQEYAFWQSVVTSRPDYRDAFIQLATLAYQLGNHEEARQWFTKAQSLDPNSSIIRQLGAVLE